MLDVIHKLMIYVNINNNNAVNNCNKNEGNN